MPPELRELQDFLKALSSETRQTILFLFADGQELMVGQVAEQARIGQSTASENLKVLKRAGILQSRRDGKVVYYAPNRARMMTLVDQLRAYLTTCCPPES